MKRMKWALILGIVAGPAVALCGCGGGGDQIPLANVSTPPPLPAQDKAKVKAPKGHSPDVLPGQP